MFILLQQCCQVLTIIHGHIRQKPQPFSKHSPPPIKIFAALRDTSKHNYNEKTMFGEGFCHFFISALPFWIEHYTDFLNLTKFVSAPYCYSRPFSPPPISHRLF
jgi:hypothetical protein